MEIGHLGGWIWPGEPGTASFSLEAGQEQEFGRRGMLIVIFGNVPERGWRPF